MRTTYIFGHKNPDTDSVCSAIALANLKRKKGIKAEAKVIGPINRETNYVLDYFKIDSPSYLNDVKVKIKDVSYTKKVFAYEYDSIYNVFNIMKNHDLTAIPLVDENKIISGYVTLKDMAKHLMNDKRDYIKTNLKHLINALDAKIITDFKNDFEGKIQTIAFSSESFINEIKLDESDILIVGDRFKVLEHAINNKVQLLVFAKGKIIPEKLLKKAVNNRVSIITSDLSSFEIANKLSLANYIKTINENKSPLTIDVNSYYTDFINLTKKYNYTNYPVVKENGECLGVLKLIDISNYEKNNVILVDHNNYEQSVTGIEEAEIEEIIDHHNIGNIGTNAPIYFTCKPVGCTGTIVADLYKKDNVEITKSIAGLLLSAILSDTLLLTSPTTTETDIKWANILAKKAKVDVQEYGINMLKAASSIKGLSVTELINQDFKQYNINDKIYGIAVITSMEFDEIEKKMDEYISKLDEMSLNTYAGVLIFITDVVKQGSYVIYNTKSKDLMEKSFNIKDIKEGHFLEGIVSRKKQILPTILKALER